MTRHQGTVTDWNDARGFGFIAPVTGGPRVFVHVSAFPRGRRPAIHDLVTYGVAPDARNRLRASGVQFVGRSRSDRRGTAALPVALVAATSFLGALVGFVALGEAPLLLLAPYGAFSLIAFEMYRADKIAAGRRGWRISEANLHAAALAGGWPGALVARHLFRHKTTKQPFRTVFWGTVVVNCGALAWFLSYVPASLMP